MNLISIHGLESCSNHNAGIALFENGKCTACLPIERITRNKLAINEPVNLEHINRVLTYRNLSIDDIDVWLLPKTFNNSKYIKLINKEKVILTDEKNHHLAHIAGSFYTSNFDHACCICCDGLGGNGESITLAYATREDGIKILKTFDFSNSLGLYYEAAADLITGRSSEGKFMGLASWGNSEGLKPIRINMDTENIINAFATRSNYEDIDEVRNDIIKYWKNTGYFVTSDEDNILRYKEFASKVQDDLNACIMDLANLIKKYYPEEENLCLSGGTFLNCTSNGILDRSGLFKNIYCTSQPHDEGQAIGKGLYYIEEVLHQKSDCKGLDCYLSFDYDVDDIYEYINKEAIIIEPYSEQKILDTLKNNGIIAWYTGRSEVGPRALGNRSLLASPHSTEMLEKMSIKVKQREFYRPLAPICIDELYTMIFDDPNPENLTQYMLKTVDVKEEWREKLPAITHVDNTARPQYLKRETNSRLYHMMQRYYEETGIPCLVNTSLNGKGDPIIESPKDLLDFMRKNPLVVYCVFNNKYIITVKDKECI